MQQEFDLLSAAAKSGNNSDCSKYFKEFCAAFLKDLCNEIPAGLFSKLIKKKTAFTAGLDYFNIIITSDIMSKIQLIDFHQAISSLFKLLMHYRMKIEIHYQSFDLFLTILDYFENTNDTVKLKLLGDLMVYGMDMSQFIENPESLYNCYIPETKTEPEYNPKQFVKLYEKFLKHFKLHQSAFTYWWTIMCESFLPVIFNSTSSQIKLVKNPKYNLNLFASALLDPSTDASKMSKLYPEYILLVISETAENHAISFYEKYSEYLSDIVITAADRFCSSISSFLYATIPILGKSLLLPDNTAMKTYMANIINVWDTIVQRKIDNAQYILITYADTIIQNPEPCSIYLILLMTYKANQVIPAKIASELKNFPDDVISIARSFGGVLACAFLQQILKLTNDDMEIIANRYPIHCGELFMHVFFQQNSQDTTISTDYMSIIEAIPVVFDTKPKLEADTFIKLFFRNWDQDPGLIKMYSTFTRTFVSAIQSLPSLIVVKTAEILIPYLNTFTKVAFETKDPLILFEAVDVVSKIVNTREIGPHITPVMTSKICLSLLKLLCVSNKNYVEIGFDRAASSILSGNPIFMTIVPFLVHILNDLKIHPKTSVVSALESALLYFTVNDITKAIESIEKKMINLLNTTNTQYSQSALTYFLQRSDGNDLKRISSKVITSNIIKIFTTIFSKSFLTDTTMSFVRIVHGYGALNIPIPPDLEDCLKSINISYNLADGMYSLIDVADALKKNNNAFLTKLVGIIITHFMIYSTEKDPRGSAQLMILAIELSRRLGDFNFIVDFLSKIKNMPDIIEVLVSHLSSSNVVSFSPDINPVCIGVSSIDALQVLNEESEKNAQLLTARYTSKTSHRFDIIEEEDKSDSIEEKVETLKSEEEDFENSNPSCQTAKLFSNLKEKIISQNLRQLLNTPSNSDQKIENDRNRPFKNLSEKTVKIERKKSKPTNSDSTLLAMYCLGLFGENRYETLPSAGNIMQAFRRVISTTVKKEAKVPLYFARGGKFDWKWSETSRDFQSFAESLGRRDKSTTRRFGDWRLDGTFFIVPADNDYKMKCEDTMNDVRVVWSEDGITISSKDFNKDKNTTVICVQPLKTGFVRITTMNAKITSLLANTNIVRAESAPSMICTTVVTLCIGNEFNTPFTLGIPNKENIIKMVPQYV